MMPDDRMDVREIRCLKSPNERFHSTLSSVTAIVIVEKMAATAKIIAVETMNSAINDAARSTTETAIQTTALMIRAL